LLAILANEYLTELKGLFIAAPVLKITAVIAKTISFCPLSSGPTGTYIYKIRMIKMLEDMEEIQVHKVTSNSPNMVVNICSQRSNGQTITSTCKALKMQMAEVGMANQDPKANGASIR